ncbi:hypothetical protein Tcan_00727, partial [Toxocara canis]
MVVSDVKVCDRISKRPALPFERSRDNPPSLMKLSLADSIDRKKHSLSKDKIMKWFLLIHCFTLLLKFGNELLPTASFFSTVSYLTICDCIHPSLGMKTFLKCYVPKKLDAHIGNPNSALPTHHISQIENYERLRLSQTQQNHLSTTVQRTSKQLIKTVVQLPFPLFHSQFLLRNYAPVRNRLDCS